MIDFKILKVLVNKFINLGGVEKNLKCKHCAEFTDHVSISFANSVDKDDIIGRVAGRINDLIPFVPLIVGNVYECTKCAMLKYDGGMLSGFFGSYGLNGSKLQS